MSKPVQQCPCGRAQPFTDCCGPYISGEHAAATAEALMRSRYVAYVLENEAYLLSTWHPSTRPSSLQLSNEAATKWLGLKIVDTRHGSATDSKGSVEFVARYKIAGKATRLHETSRFVREQGKWYYLDGDLHK